MEKPEVIVCHWTVSLYEDKKRKWNYGNISLKADGIEFIPNDAKSTSGGIMLLFEDLIDIKKATTGLVFGAVYVLRKDNKKIWFSSLEDRDGFYGTLQHFWKAQLFSKKDEGVSKAGQGRKTKLGQTLVSLVQDSQDTLSKAAVQLNEQGRQIDSSIWAMAELHNDLDVTERFVTDLNSWVGRWRLPKQYYTVDPIVVNKCDIPDVFETEVVYTKLETGKANTRVVGLLRMSQDGIYILSPKQALVHHYRWSDVSRIRVVTPYELMVIKYQLGKPDLVYALVCANMLAILQLIEKCAKYKLEYDKAPETIVCTNHEASAQRHTVSLTQGKQETFSRHTHHAGPESFHTTNTLPDTPQLQVQQAPQVNDREIDQICEGLTSLKSLALAVQEEEGVQNEKLDSLTTSVDRANERLTVINKRVKRMV